MRWLEFLLPVAMLASVGVARADVVLHDGGVERDAAAAKMVEAHTGAVPGLVLPVDVLSGPADALSAGLDSQPCGGGVIKVDLVTRLDAISELVLSFQLDEALAVVGELDSLLPCAAEPVPGTLLARLAFLAGAARLDQGDADAAADAMADAAAADPAYEGERGFPTDHLALLETARAARAEVPLYIWPGPGTTQVLLDGVAVEGIDRAGARVGAGRHLLQIGGPDGLTGAWLDVHGDEAILMEARGGQRLWPDLGSSPGAAAALRLLVGAEFDAADGDVHLLTFDKRTVRAATVTAGGGALQTWDPPKAEPARTTRPTPPSDDARRVHIVLGGGWHFAEPFHFGAISADVAIRVVGPLEVGLFGRPSLRPYDDGTTAGLVAFVPAGLTVGVRKAGAVSPWVAGAGQLAWNRDGTDGARVLGGAGLHGGLDLAPGDGPLVLRIGGEVGFLGRHITARALGGVGVRF